jgi:hypothetical protein
VSRSWGARGASNGRSWLAGLAEVHRASLWILRSNKNERRTKKKETAKFPVHF